MESGVTDKAGWATVLSKDWLHPHWGDLDTSGTHSAWCLCTLSFQWTPQHTPYGICLPSLLLFIGKPKDKEHFLNDDKPRDLWNDTTQFLTELYNSIHSLQNYTIFPVPGKELPSFLTFSTITVSRFHHPETSVQSLECHRQRLWELAFLGES